MNKTLNIARYYSTDRDKISDMLAASDLASLDQYLQTTQARVTRRVRNEAYKVTKLRRRIPGFSGGAQVKLKRDLRATIKNLAAMREQCEATLYELTATALSEHQHNGEPMYTADTVRGWCEHAQALGAGKTTLSPELLSDLLYSRKVPVAPLQARYLQLKRADGQNDDLASIATVLMRLRAEQPKYEERDLLRQLGLEVRDNGRGTTSLAVFISYEQAVKLALAMDAAPYQVGV